VKAAIYQGDHRFEVKEVPTPEPGPGEIVIKTHFCSICGTDVHGVLYDVATVGSVLGHEYSGTVSAIGPGVTLWKIGDRVAGAAGGAPPKGSKSLFVENPRYNFRTMGWGTLPPAFSGYAEYILMDAWMASRVPDGVSDLQASMVEPMAAAYQAVDRSHMSAGDTVGVLGAGPLGLFALQIAKAKGASKVIVSEPAPARAAAARELGADEVLDPTKEDVVERMAELTDGKGPHVIIEAAGAQPTLQQALEAVRYAGRVVLLAIAWEQVPVLPADWCTRDLELTTTFAFKPEWWPECYKLLQSGAVRVEPMLKGDSIIALDDIEPTFKRLFKPSDEIKMVVDFEK
jgi:(R,R)-butanediol dehydrogenase/meso-butanediol dehydrogenase/diacetyl reductase